MNNQECNTIFLDIADSCYNGQWTYAAEQCVKHNFYAKDLVESLNETETSMISMEDLVFLIENATNLRINKKLTAINKKITSKIKTIKRTPPQW